jgi:hypothetical protein
MVYADSTGATDGFCMERCTAQSDCGRAGYACQFNGALTLTDPTTMAMTTEVMRICDPVCTADADCGMSNRCSDGVCEFSCAEQAAADSCVEFGGTCTATFCTFP